jgi:acyl-CoA reductase-like NAD-dependent aldehyde dehydrogenase
VKKLLETQKAACIREGLPSAETRIERLDKSIALLCDHVDALCEAMSADFGHRSIDQSRFSDISGSIDTLEYAKKNRKGGCALPAQRCGWHHQPMEFSGESDICAAGRRFGSGQSSHD